MDKKLYKSNVNKQFDGICGGIGEYFGIDPTLVRLGWILLSVFSGGAGILAYIVCMFVIPRNPVV